MDLRQGTAQTVTIGQFVDKGDGVTPETGLEGSMAVKIAKNGGARAAITPTSIVDDSEGYYRVTFTTAHVDTLGRLKLTVTDAATHLPVWHDFHVLPPNVFDTLYGSDKLQVDLREVQGRATLWGKTWDTVIAAIASVVAGRRAGGDHKSPSGVTEETIVAATVSGGDRTAATWNDPA
jgi:hypothetical protein